MTEPGWGGPPFFWWQYKWVHKALRHTITPKWEVQPGDYKPTATLQCNCGMTWKH